MQLLPPVILLLVATIVPAALALYIYVRGGTSGLLLLGLMLLAMSEWALAYALELAFSDHAIKILFAKTKLVGALALPSLWLAYALYRTGRTGWLDLRNLVLLAVPPALMMALVWTGAAWRYPRPGSSGPQGTLVAEPGLWSWVILAYSHALILVGVALLVSGFFYTQRLYRRQCAVVLLAVLAPWAASAANLADLSPLAHLDLTPFAFPLTAVVLSWGIWRYRLLDIVPVDRGYAVEGMSDGMVVLDSRNRILDLNPAAERIIGRTGSEAIGQTISRLVSNRTGWLIEGGRDTDVLARHGDPGKEFAEVSIGEGPDRRHYGLVLSSLGRENDQRSNRLLLLHDITERKSAEGHLDRLAHYDPLTQLPNRRLFYDRLKQAIAQARRRKTMVAVLFLDLDLFKHINDTLGHDVGDLVLTEVANRVANCVRETDTVSRLAGDEFVVLLTDVAERDDISMVAQRIVEAISEPYERNGHDLRVTASVGISVYPSNGQEETDLLEKADAAMYHAKAMGTNRFEFYPDETSVEVQEGLGEGLELALERGEFVVHYQPIVSMESGKVFGTEALVRWQHPERGLLAPVEFIPLAEKTGTIVPIGLWVLKESCARATRWRESRGAGHPLTMCVNLSAGQLEHPDLVGDVERILRETGLAANDLLLEIGESTIMKGNWTAAILGRLKGLGVRIAIDDFGTGYSSLPHLNRLPIDFLKIDRSLVDGLEEDPEKKIATAAMVGLAHALGMGVIGEGVETSRQFGYLKRIGCDLVQGHYLGEARPPEEAERTISFIDLYN